MMTILRFFNKNYYLACKICLVTALLCSFITFSASAKNKINNTNKINNISIVDKKNSYIDLKFELDKTSTYKVFTIKNPYRLVVDFDNATLNFNIKTLSHPLFSVIKSNSSKKGLRIVFSLDSNVSIKHSVISKIKGKYFLIITLNQDIIYKLINKESLLENKLEKSSNYIAKKPKILPIIIIDAGHGGKDPGTIGFKTKIKEKNITLLYAQELKKQLDRTRKFKVILTRGEDYFISLKQRVKIAQEHKANLLISIHADSSPDKKTSGLSIYTLSETSSDKQADLLAQKENKADIIYGANFSDANQEIIKTLINLSQRNSMNESAKFAEMIIKSMKLEGIDTLQKTHRFAGFKVLTAPDLPSVLIELGYLSNPLEAKKLDNTKYREKVAKSLLTAIEQYF